VEVPVTGITFDKANETLTVNNKFQLNPQITPINATNKSIIWETNNPSVATVDGNGFVTAVDSGTAVITAITIDGSFKANCIVTVRVPVTEIYLDKSAVELKVNETLPLIDTVMPENATNNLFYGHPLTLKLQMLMKMG
jgi:uncharacterized protein YjdB